jgi:hypothetical protein
MNSRIRVGGVWLLGAILTFAVLAPLALERLGVVSTTTEIGVHAMSLRGAGLLSGPMQDLVFVLYVIVLVGAAIGYGRGLHANELALRTRLHTITWHLKQLLPANPPSNR